jgi:hypothetical protein
MKCSNKLNIRKDTSLSEIINSTLLDDFIFLFFSKTLSCMKKLTYLHWLRLWGIRWVFYVFYINSVGIQKEKKEQKGNSKRIFILIPLKK